MTGECRRKGEEENEMLKEEDGGKKNERRKYREKRLKDGYDVKESEISRKPKW